MSHGIETAAAAKPVVAGLLEQVSRAGSRQ